ncbi:uncharacterized protein HD556DRAFT_1403635 [Suillus plorans]|uniref:Uncharacterized protein n=1 Tax=Suillus plorans TaxID=116603 RepID=A0A9P7DDJ2_9AGAM|nr:uncharacterized protein HD556DRAFT_1403635 [Suillus plorans]KAG1788462.1 hypothetical protein HD556DRAFT_1403635 [Suillus plorans]
MISTIMNYNPTQLIAVFLCLSSSAYAQTSDTYSYNWSGRIAGIVVGIVFLFLLLIICCVTMNRRRRRSMPFVSKPPTNAQPGPPYSLPIWQGAQTYAPPPRPGHPANTANMNPYDNEYPGSQPPPPPYVKGEGPNMPQETHYSSPPGPPPAAHTRENNHFV